MLIVKKFGGTSVADKERIFNVAKRCIRDYQNGNDVVVVLSAMGKYTDELIAKAKEINPNPYDEDIFEEQQQKVKANEISNTFQTVELDIKKPNGVMRSVLKGPSSTEKKQAKLVVQSTRNTLLKNNFNDNRTENEVKLELQELSGEHLGYLHPRRVKNIKHDFNKMPSEIHENVPDSDSDSEEDENQSGLQNEKPVDPFYDD